MKINKKYSTMIRGTVSDNERRIKNMRAGFLFGINYVRQRKELQLNGCHTDVESVHVFLKSLGYTIVETFTDAVTDGPVKRASILETLETIVKQTHDMKMEEVFLHFSGHGSNQMDFSRDERDGLDECIVPVDYGVAGMISDDLLISYFKRIHPRTRVICLFDCCHSGTIAVRLRRSTTTIFYETVDGSRDHLSLRVPGFRDFRRHEYVRPSINWRNDDVSIDGCQSSTPEKRKFIHTTIVERCSRDVIAIPISTSASTIFFESSSLHFNLARNKGGLINESVVWCN
jgi:hypothetical protein